LGAEIVYLCPVADEVDPSIVHMFPDSLIGVSPQGWMRQWDSSGRVSPRKWEDAPTVLPHADVLVMSEEDVSPFPEVMHEYMDLAKIVVLTRGEKGSTLLHDGQSMDFPAFPTYTVDPTGAGDVFAAAFLIRFRQTHDLYEASVFANCAASFVVEKGGTEGIPDLDRVCSRMTSRLVEP
jgi:sugar/nucleoside kinase (ribokinase family)